eukprot:3115474-Prymnesium_polylepis.1
MQTAVNASWRGRMRATLTREKSSTLGRSHWTEATAAARLAFATTLAMAFATTPATNLTADDATFMLASAATSSVAAVVTTASAAGSSEATVVMTGVVTIVMACAAAGMADAVAWTGELGAAKGSGSGGTNASTSGCSVSETVQPS